MLKKNMTKRFENMRVNNSAKPTLWQVLVSVLGAFFGVQSSQVQTRDFSAGRLWWVYVLVGVFVAMILVLLLIWIASYVSS